MQTSQEIIRQSIGETLSQKREKIIVDNTDCSKCYILDWFIFCDPRKHRNTVNPEPKQRNILRSAIQFNTIDWSNYRQRVREFCDRLNSVSDCEHLLLLSEDFIINENKHYALISEKQFNNFQMNLAELSRLFPRNHTDPIRLKILIKILLEQQLETCWYDDFPRYVNAEDIKNDVKLYDLTASASAYPIEFSFIVLRENGIHRIISQIERRIRGWLNHPAGGTVGMKTIQCKLEMIVLLNEICDRVSKVYGKEVSLQINSIIRTVEHQKHLAHLGYWAPPNSSHSTGYAADIERRWYYDHNRPLFTIIDQILQDYEKRLILNVINENSVWHICLNPQWIEFYQKLIKH